MAAYPPVRMPSSEWAGKDRPIFFRSPSSQLRHQASVSKNPFRGEASKQDAAPFSRGSTPPISSVGAHEPASAPPPATTNPFAPSYGASALSTQASALPADTSMPAVASSANASNPDAVQSVKNVPVEASEPSFQTSSPSHEASLASPVQATESKDAKNTVGIRNSVGSAIESVSETVKPYLPESIAAILPTSFADRHRTSEFPSKETPSGAGGGVGSLPGNMSETSVAKLPEERANESHEKKHHKKHRGSDTSSKTANKTSTSPSMYQSAKNYFRRSVGAYLSGASSSQLPSKETPGGSAVGVGSLPGNTSEISVAKLPEERRLEVMPSQETGQEVLGKSGGVGALPGNPNESRVAMLPEERIHPQYDANPTAMESTGSQDASKKQPLTVEGERQDRGLHASGAAAVGVGAGAGAHHGLSDKNKHAGVGGTFAHPDVRMDPGYHPAELHPLDPKFKPESSKGPSSSQSHHEASANTNVEDKKRHSSASAESDGRSISSGERRKVGFKDKVKGEVKVISGKLSHNEKKIEEGRQMMGK